MIIKPQLTLSIGDTFDDMVCIDISIKRQKSGYTARFYTMQCIKCNRTKEMLSSTIRMHKGTTHKSCGKGLKTQNIRFYNKWQAMRTRTTNPNYEHADCYVNRGINSDEFENFIDFYDTMYESYIELANKIGEKNISLERIDVNKPYSKENCKWIHISEQQGNTRKNVKFKVTFPDGHTEIHKNARKFAKEHNLDPATVMDAMNPNRATKQHKNYKFERL